MLSILTEDFFSSSNLPSPTILKFMKVKCQRCGLVNGAEVQFCQRCQTGPGVENKTEKINPINREPKMHQEKPEPKKVPFLMNVLFICFYVIGAGITFFCCGGSFVVMGKLNSVTILIVSVTVSMFLPLAVVHLIVENWKESIRYPPLKADKPREKLTIEDYMNVFAIIMGFAAGIVSAALSGQYFREWGIGYDDALAIPSFMVGLGTMVFFVWLSGFISRRLGVITKK
jgi:hypothetical protein